MMQDALIALARCAQRFDPARGVPFTSYISPRISGEVRDYMRYRVDPLSREDRRRRRLKGQEPRPDVSFELLEYDKEDRHRYLEQTDAVDELRSVLAEFSDRERRMCLSWFGSELPMHTIAKQEGLCESRVSQLMTGVRQRLRARFGEDAAPRVPKKHPKKMVRCLVTS